MNYTTLPNGDTVASPDELPQMLEVEEGFLDGLPAVDLQPYDDKAPTHNPTIGFGINLRSSDNIALVLNQILIGGQNVFTAAAGTGASDVDVVNSFSAIIARYPGGFQGNITALNSALSNQLALWFGVPPQNGIFQINESEAKTILNQVVQGYTVGSYSADSCLQVEFRNR